MASLLARDLKKEFHQPQTNKLEIYITNPTRIQKEHCNTLVKTTILGIIY